MHNYAGTRSLRSKRFGVIARTSLYWARPRAQSYASTPLGPRGVPPSGGHADPEIFVSPGHRKETVGRIDSGDISRERSLGIISS